jgi:hypothetical protein
VVSSFIHCVGYSAHKQACNQYKHKYLPAELEGKNKEWRNKLLFVRFIQCLGGNKSGKGVAKFGINLV